MLAPRFQKLVVGSFAFALAMAACGSDDSKNAVRGGDGGAAGDEAVEPGDAGSGPSGSGDAGEHGGGAEAGSGGTPGSSGGESGVSGGADAAAGAGGTGSTPDPTFEIGAYVSPSGDDALGTGTADDPFETLSKAASVVQTGQAIGLLDGTHIVDYFAQIPDGVALVGVNEGGATIGQMPNFNGGVSFLGDGAIDGLRIGYAVNLLNAAAGTLRVTNTQFGAHGDGSGNDAAFVISGSGELILEAPSPEAPWYFEPNGGRIAQMADGSKLSVAGGVFEGGTGGSVFFAYSGNVDMAFRGVSFVDCSGARVIGLNNGGIGVNASTLLLDGVTIDNSGTESAIYVGFGTPTVTIENSSIDTQNGIGILIQADNYAQAQTQTVNIENSLITGNEVGIQSYYHGQAALTLIDTNVDANTTGIRFMFTDNDEGSSLDMTGGSIADNAAIGFDATSETNKPIKLKLRGVEVSGNGGHGLLAYGNAGSLFDLGTAAAPGNNVLQNPGAANANAALVVNAPTLVNAIGNTWLPSQQGASATGKYVPDSGDYREVTGIVATGQNYRIVGAGQTLRL